MATITISFNFIIFLALKDCTYINPSSVEFKFQINIIPSDPPDKIEPFSFVKVIQFT